MADTTLVYSVTFLEVYLVYVNCTNNRFLNGKKKKKKAHWGHGPHGVVVEFSDQVTPVGLGVI